MSLIVIDDSNVILITAGVVPTKVRKIYEAFGDEERDSSLQWEEVEEAEYNETRPISRRVIYIEEES